MDQDTQAVTERIDDALGRSGLSLRQFATALGTSPSRLSAYRSGRTAPSAAFLLRAERIADALMRARTGRLPSSIDAARAVRRAAQRGDEDWTLSIVLEARDSLRRILRQAPTEAAAWEAQPVTGDEHWDAMLAALVAHEFDAASLPAPAWTRSRRLEEPWFLDSPRLSRAEVRAQTPAWLSRHNVYAAPRDLATL